MADRLFQTIQPNLDLTQGSVKNYTDFLKSNPSYQNAADGGVQAYTDFLRTGPNRTDQNAYTQFLKTNPNYFNDANTQNGVLNYSKFINDPNAQAEYLSNNPIVQQQLANTQRTIAQQNAHTGRVGTGDYAVDLQNATLQNSLPFLQQRQQQLGTLADMQRSNIEAQGTRLGTLNQIEGESEAARAARLAALGTTEQALRAQQDSRLGDLSDLQQSFQNQYNVTDIGRVNDMNTAATNLAAINNQYTAQKQAGRDKVINLAVQGVGAYMGANAGLAAAPATVNNTYGLLPQQGGSSPIDLNTLIQSIAKNQTRSNIS